MTQTAAEIAAEMRRAGSLVDSPPATPIRGGDQFRDQNNNPAGIRHHHAAGVVERGVRRERYDLGDEVYITLAAELIELGNPYTMLVTGIEMPTMGAGTVLDHAWRIYDAEPEATPTDLFAGIVEQFGIEVSVGDRSGLFIGKTKAPSGEMVRADTSGGTFEVGAMMRSLPDGSMEITWAYAIDRARYEASVRKGRG